MAQPFIYNSINIYVSFANVYFVQFTVFVIMPTRQWVLRENSSQPWLRDDSVVEDISEGHHPLQIEINHLRVADGKNRRLLSSIEKDYFLSECPLDMFLI